MNKPISKINCELLVSVLVTKRESCFDSSTNVGNAESETHGIHFICIAFSMHSVYSLF